MLFDSPIPLCLSTVHCVPAAPALMKHDSPLPKGPPAKPPALLKGNSTWFSWLIVMCTYTWDAAQQGLLPGHTGRERRTGRQGPSFFQDL